MTVRTLTDDELQRVRAELGHNVLAVGALPYIGHAAIFDVIRDYCQSSSVDPTTSSTAVTAALVAAGGVTITVASASGLVVGARVQVDVDANREVCSVRSISGTTLGLNLRKPHAGTYPVEIESGLTQTRAVLSDLALLQDQINEATGSAGIRKVDEVEFWGPADGRTMLDELYRQRDALRANLGVLVGLAPAARHAGRYEVY